MHISRYYEKHLFLLCRFYIDLISLASHMPTFYTFKITSL